MLINGYKVAVLPSIFTFLKLVQYLPEFAPDTWWWIDSICIDQSDEREKMVQVAIMGSIYLCAHKTVVWLGEEVEAVVGGEGEGRVGTEAEDSRDRRRAVDNLFRLCNELDKARRKTRRLKGNDIQSQIDVDNAWKGEIRHLRAADSGLDWGAVKRFLLRPWWRRVWTLQEFLISDKLDFYCGSRSISRRDCMDAVYAAHGCQAGDSHLLGGAAYHAAWQRRRMEQWYASRKSEISLLATLAYVGECRATQEKDRVCLALEDVYSAVAKGFIRTYDSLDVICYAHLFNHSARGVHSKPALPSWVPDWRARVEGKHVPVMVAQGSKAGTGNFRPEWARVAEEKHGYKAMYNASGGKSPRRDDVGDGRTLTCWGVILDKIDGLGGSTYDDAGKIVDSKKQPSLQQSGSAHNLRQNKQKLPDSLLMDTIARCFMLDRTDRYLAKEMAPGDFRHSLESVYKTYFERHRGNGSRNGRTLEEHCREASLHTTLPEWVELSKGPVRNLGERLHDTLARMARRLTLTRLGYLGMAASRAETGDLVCVLLGCSVPVLLRERKDEGTFEFIGECYLDGFMSGEALKKGSGFTETRF
ncbi:heterokaryon incompatibility protein-domain-containing protein [Leptodontidium sp. MPI-SDFR-AT-0119]|nr:heterokaryon incompatibility protein-domain-containing protein [Leptodontidium sp. MPI-SDFR-AT-0119]